MTTLFEDLNKLCNKYDFTYDTIGNYVRIFSKRDTWYFVNKDYKSFEAIKLYHANHYGGAGIHKQKSEFNNLYQIFEYISRHDKKELMKRDKVFRIAEKLKILYVK
jgi:hypothetical protein